MWPAIIGAGASLISGIMGRKSAEAQNEANSAVNLQQLEFNRVEAEKQRGWQERQLYEDRAYNIRNATTAYERARELSGTAHQRQVADLRGAGLNPILSARYGGASTPPVAAPTSKAGQGATASAGSLKTMVNTGQAGITAALDTMRLHAQAELARAQTGQASAQAGKTEAETELVNIDKRTRDALNVSNVERNRMTAWLNREQAIIEQVYKPAQIDAVIKQMRSSAAANFAKAEWQGVSTQILRHELHRAAAFARAWSKNPTVSVMMAYLQEGAKAGLTVPQMVSAASKFMPWNKTKQLVFGSINLKQMGGKK